MWKDSERHLIFSERRRKNVMMLISKTRSEKQGYHAKGKKIEYQKIVKFFQI